LCSSHVYQSTRAQNTVHPRRAVLWTPHPVGVGVPTRRDAWRVEARGDHKIFGECPPMADGDARRRPCAQLCGSCQMRREEVQRRGAAERGAEKRSSGKRCREAVQMRGKSAQRMDTRESSRTSSRAHHRPTTELMLATVMRSCRDRDEVMSSCWRRAT